jgi:hypothetical protein
MTLAPALHRLGLSKQQQDFWGVQLEHAIEEYNQAHIRDQQQASLGSHTVYYELGQFHWPRMQKTHQKAGLITMP